MIPPWIIGALTQARTFNACPIALIAESAALAQANLPKSLDIAAYALEDIGVSEKHEIFLEISPLDRAFRGGFWTHTTERFFAIESAIEKYSLKNVVHLENDVLLYCDLNLVVPKLFRLYCGIAATFDNDTRCVPGIMYIPDAGAIGKLTDYILTALQTPMSVREVANINDMALLGSYRLLGATAIDHLPIIPPDYPAELRSASGHVAADASCYSKNFDTLGMIFDAAALGQYLGGIDPRNDRRPSHGFVNESCLFDPRLLKVRMARDARGLVVPVVETASGIHPVANLHIHSKNPAPFLSTPG
jgi:hypothetical protein